MNRLLKRGAIVFLLSDFLMPAENYQHDLLVTSRQHETINIVLSDPLEEAIPDVGIMGVEDAETGDVQFVDTSSEKWQTQFREQRMKLLSERDIAFRRAGVGQIDMPPDGDYIRALSHFFQQQARKRAR